MSKPHKDMGPTLHDSTARDPVMLIGCDTKSTGTEQGEAGLQPAQKLLVPKGHAHQNDEKGNSGDAGCVYK